MEIIPSILTDEVDLVFEQVEVCKESGLVHRLQLDVIDGMFADNITIFPSDLMGISFANLKIDIHLMTQDPMDFVHELRDMKKYVPVGVVLGQVEQMHSQKKFLKEVKKNGWQAGLSLNLHTPLEAIDDEVWEFLDAVQIMGVKAGFSGQQFSTTALNMISELNDYIMDNDLDIEIIVDGGVTLDNLDEVASFGADAVVVGSALWQSRDFKEKYQDFLEK